MMHALCMELKNGFEILVGQAVFKLWLVKILFWSINQEPIGLSQFFHAIFEFLGQLAIRYYIFQKGVDNFKKELKTC